jgi:glycosyltransferase involved in cell wall biosynthesis
MNKLSSLSVFFPCYNEADNLGLLIKQALEVFPIYAEKFELIIINDGSKDNTGQVADRLAAANSNIRVHHQDNLGYGGAVKAGLAACKYDWIFFTDSDLQFDLNELSSFVEQSLQADFLIGFRKKRADGWRRTLNARLLKLWDFLFLGLPFFIKDINCAFKLMRKDAVQKCLPLRSNGAMVSTELLIKAYRTRARFVQIGVSHFPRIHGEQTGGKPMVIGKAVKETVGVWQELRSFERQP